MTSGSASALRWRMPPKPSRPRYGSDRTSACSTSGCPASGLAAAWEIAARLPQAKIVMLTVSDDDADLFAALRAGADGYLLKTMNLRRLPDALEGVYSGEAAMPRTLVARLLEQLPRARAPLAPACRRRQLRRPADQP